MDIRWVKIDSWHAIRGDSMGHHLTMCGRVVNELGETSETLPAEKSCENCLRIVARAMDIEPAGPVPEGEPV
jgi:hypothetical protein